MSETNEPKIPPKNNVHIILAHSYVSYFALFLFAFFLHIIFPTRIPDFGFIALSGWFLIVFSTILIFWAQKTSRSLNKENLSKESFCRGPYCYTRTPTHWGMFLLILGFGFTMHSLFIILFTVLSFVISKIFFIRKQENILLEKYGNPYLEYQKSVKF